MLWIYFIQAGVDGPIKIGITGDVEARVYELQVSNAAELRILAVRPGTHAVERALHRRFAEHQIRGEWFSPAAPGLRDEIRRSRDMETALAAGHSRFCHHCGQPVHPPRTRICSDACERDRKRQRSAEWRKNHPAAISPEDQPFETKGPC